MKNLRRKIEDMLSAVSFAEAGEYEAARALVEDSRTVLLALKQGRIESKTLKYALNSAKRMSARLDILYVSSPEGQQPGADPLFSRFLADLSGQGTLFQVVRKTGCLKQALLDYTNREQNIMFAVVESPGSLDADCKEKDHHLSELWRNLRCPLVVVMDEAKA